jgi:integrase
MKGHIRERSPGHWAIVIDARDQTGKRKRRWFSFRGTKREAQRRCAELIVETRGGTATSPERMTVEQYLGRWLDHMRPLVSHASHERYSQAVRVNLTPLIGETRLAKLSPMQISGAYATMICNGLAPGTVALAHSLLSHALKLAVRWRLLLTNPCNDVSPPRKERREMKVWNTQTMAAAIDLSRDRQCHIPVLLACLCGMRLGEIAALRWRHVDLDRSLIAVVESTERASARIKPPKSGRGRSVTLPALAVTELQAWRLRQAEEFLRLGIRPNDDTRVVTRADGLPVQPNSIYQAWASFLADSGLPRIRFHDLRHSHATALLSRGVHPKIASERLGHSNVSITLDVYSHVIGNMQDGAAAAIDAAFSEKKGSKAVAIVPLNRADGLRSRRSHGKDNPY